MARLPATVEVRVADIEPVKHLIEVMGRAATFEVTAWARDDEDVVTMSRADCDQLIGLLDDIRAAVKAVE